MALKWLTLGVLAGAAALTVAGVSPAAAVSAQEAEKAYAQSPRPRVVIRPRKIKPGPNAKRHCRSWLAQEYRVSGTVIVPKMECWWQ